MLVMLLFKGCRVALETALVIDCLVMRACTLSCRSPRYVGKWLLGLHAEFQNSRYLALVRA